MWSDLEQPQCIDGCDRSAARADLDHVDHRGLDRQPGTLGEAVDASRFEHRHHLELPVLNQRCLCRGAAHVERDDILLAG